MTTPDQPPAACLCGTAMHACLAALAHQLAEAQQLAADARDAMHRNERNLAIGTLLPLEQLLPECDAMVRAVRTLNRWHYRSPTEAQRAAEGGAQ